MPRMLAILASLSNRVGRLNILCRVCAVVTKQSAGDDVLAIDQILLESEKVRGSAVQGMRDLLDDYDEQNKVFDREVGARACQKVFDSRNPVL